MKKALLTLSLLSTLFLLPWRNIQAHHFDEMQVLFREMSVSRSECAFLYFWEISDYLTANTECGHANGCFEGTIELEGETHFGFFGSASHCHFSIVIPVYSMRFADTVAPPVQLLAERDDGREVLAEGTIRRLDIARVLLNFEFTRPHTDAAVENFVAINRLLIGHEEPAGAEADRAAGDRPRLPDPRNRRDLGSMVPLDPNDLDLAGPPRDRYIGNALDTTVQDFPDDLTPDQNLQTGGGACQLNPFAAPQGFTWAWWLVLAGLAGWIRLRTGGKVQ